MPPSGSQVKFPGIYCTHPSVIQQDIYGEHPSINLSKEGKTISFTFLLVHSNYSQPKSF